MKRYHRKIERTVQPKWSLHYSTKQMKLWRFWGVWAFNWEDEDAWKYYLEHAKEIEEEIRKHLLSLEVEEQKGFRCLRIYYEGIADKRRMEKWFETVVTYGDEVYWREKLPQGLHWDFEDLNVRSSDDEDWGLK